MKKVCVLKSLSQKLQFNKKMINDVAGTMEGIDKNKLSRITGALDYACRSLHTMIKSYIYPKIDGPKYQETCYDDDMPGVSFLVAEGHAYYTEVAAERIIKKFHAQWRPVMVEDITADNPLSESLLGTWGMKDDGTLGIIGLCGSFGDSVKTSRPCIDKPLDANTMLRLVLVRKR